MNKNIEFAERTGTSVPTNVSKHELFAYASQLHKKLEEEVAEMFDALVAKDVTELLDACKDINVYLDQFKDSLIKAGIDVIGAQEAVALNNELKYTTYTGLVLKWLGKHINNGNEDYFIETNTIDGVDYHCIKNWDNKVIKPVGHPRVDLKEFIPDELLNVKPTWDSFFKSRFEKISTQEEYDALKNSGMAYEVEIDLEDTWQEFCIAKEKWFESKLEG